MNDNPQATALLTAWMRAQEEINKEVASQLNRLDIELTAANALIAELEGEAPAEQKYEKCAFCDGWGYEEEDHGHYPCRRGCPPAVAQTDTQPDTFNAKH